jgi:signal peptidase I
MSTADVPSPQRALRVTPRAYPGDWLKSEPAHFILALILGCFVWAAGYFLGFDVRYAAVAGVIIVVFGRNITRFILPEHKPEPGPSPSPSATPAAAPTDTVREIVETIVFVVVLVLLLKSFVAEAFVIPTGSMATTLWGYQRVVDCPECGYRFPVNAAPEADPQDGSPARAVTGCTCPNCRYVINFADEARKHPGWTAPGWSSGDRVLVAKFLYDLLNRQPDRLDVVVFKFPGDSFGTPWPQSGPYSRNYVPMNYIKRLIGLPGEIIAVHGGNLYRIPADKVPKQELEELAADAEDAARPGAAQLWQTRFTHTKTGSEARRFFEEHRSLFEIIRKSPETMIAMSRIVYDNDYPAKDLTSERWERWTGGAWSEAGRGFAHAAAGDTGTDWLTYRHVLRDADGNHRNGEAKPELITDFMGYNSGTYANSNFVRGPVPNWVKELLVECDATVEKPEGALILALSRGVDRFEARFDVAGGTCKLVRIDDKGETVLDERPTEIKKPGKHRLRFADYDERLTVWVDDALPFGDGVVFSPPADSGPKKENDLERPAAIGCKGAAVRLEHLRLFRDTYYTTQQATSPSDGDAGQVDWSNPSAWDSLRDLPVRTMDVQPGHFLCLGDNSPESSDGRTWGLVPDRLMLGRALLVYFPFNRMGRIH